MPVAGGGDAGAPIPAVPADFSTLDATHPVVRELFDRAEVARRVADLTKIQKRNNPELLLATTRQRDAFGEAWQQTITVGVRFPFGSESRNRAKEMCIRDRLLCIPSTSSGEVSSLTRITCSPLAAHSTAS